MPTTTESELETRKAIALRSIEIMATGTREDFAEVLHPEFFNHEQRDEPPATRGPGPDQTYGVAEWLRTAYADLRWDVHDVVAEEDLVVVRCTMSGRHVGDFVAYDLDGRVAEAFAPTGRRFASAQAHWLRIRDGRPVEHWANRDDLGMGEQLGWAPPTPPYLVRCALAKRRARRAAGPPVVAEERPFPRWDGASERAKEMALRETIRATSEWLGDAFDDVDWIAHHVVAERGMVAVHLTVGGRHVAPFALADRVFPPTGRRFSATQTHWLRLTDGHHVVEHRADRDDLGMAMQLGWVPPSPRYLARMALAKRRARR
jgi:predicted ester cyclase